MPLAPEYVALFEQAAQQDPPPPPIWEMTPTDAREMYRAMRPVNPDLPIHKCEDRTIPGPGGDLSVRVYTPQGPAPSVRWSTFTVVVGSSVISTRVIRSVEKSPLWPT